jgi:hypothetical protein
VVVTLIVICEIGFWVLLAAGLGVRYLLRMPRTGLAILACEPLLELTLLVVTALDLKNGAEPSMKHGIAALYIGYTVGHGHRTIKWLDGHAAHRFAGGPPPVKPPRYGMARARHEGAVWLGTLVAAVVASVLLLAAMWYVGDASRTGSLREWIMIAWRSALIHGLIALSYAIRPRKAPAGERDEAAAQGAAPEGEGPEGARGVEVTERNGAGRSPSALPARHPQHVPDVLVGRAGKDEQ